MIAVDAVPEFCEQAARRFSAEVRAGQLTIVNRAIVDRPGPVTFYTNPNSEWGTVHPAWADRNALPGSPSPSQITVEGITAASIFGEHRDPYYVKVDIEGSDRLVLEALRGLDRLPKFVSFESEGVSWQALLAEFDLLEQLGYRRFKIVAQHNVPRQVAPNPPLEGEYAGLRLSLGSSGLFGEEAPGRWLTRDQAVATYRLIFATYRLLGGWIDRKRDPLSLGLRGIRKVLRPRGNWYDTHAGR